eukprot:TRINITY_DN8187_c0_g1_i1.p1 TRINITY_DN8187_c0_g1~~TRINITY_DN8187_c0_g1_i1.p1  ORF type:complete len:302 (+),score=104.58 TRINITY_DN8187_c0_g1_i1:61-966(+)
MADETIDLGAEGSVRTPAKKKRGSAAEDDDGSDDESEYDWMYMSDIRKVKAGGVAGKPNYDDLSAWTKYTPEISENLEKAYLEYLAADRPTAAQKKLKIVTRKVPYVVRFSDEDGGMRQYRVSDESLQRPVQRRKRSAATEAMAASPKKKSAASPKKSAKKRGHSPSPEPSSGDDSAEDEDDESGEEPVWMFMSDIRKVKTGGYAGKPNYDDLSAWTKYDDKTSGVLEKGYIKFQACAKPTKREREITIRCGKKEYQVSFCDPDGGMRQWRKADPDRQRPVQRRLGDSVTKATPPAKKRRV